MKFQRGGFAVGLIVGLLIGLVLALGVALYVTKAPVPFVNKVPQRTAEQDAAETERNKKWDPNAPLAGKALPRAAAPASAAASAAAPAVATAPRAAQPVTKAAAVAVAVPATASEPVATKTTKASAEPYTYFAQAGAYSRAEDAQAQRARLALIGLDAKIIEREQTGRTVYRVRIGPFERRTDAEAVLEQLNSASVESSLVRVERQ